jgi:hypothetical protein
MRSPNVRLERDTKKRLDLLHDWVVDILDVGKRAVTTDILTAAALQVVNAHRDELLNAVRQQWVRRQAKEEE